MKLLNLVAVVFSFATTAFAQGELTPADVASLLGSHSVILCSSANKELAVQVQLDGARAEWNVWFSKDGAITGGQRITTATVIQLEGMRFLNEFNLELERGTQIRLTLDENGEGDAFIKGIVKSYKMQCAPKGR